MNLIFLKHSEIIDNVKKLLFDIEYGMGRVSLHEKKNFSHERFSILKTMPSNLMI